VQIGDHFSFWYAGHLVVTGASPYELTAWRLAASYGPIPEGVAVNVLYPLSDAQLEIFWAYPPWTALALAPLGALPLTVGVLAWHALLVVAGFTALIASAWMLGLRSGPALAVGLTALALSNPVVNAMRAGHFDVVILCGAIVLTLGAMRGRTPLVVVGALLIAFKPHLVLLVVPMATWTLMRARAWGSIGAAAVALIAMAIAAFALVQVDLSRLAARLSTKSSDGLATTWDLGRQLAPAQPWAAAAGLIALSFLCAVVVDRTAPAERRTAVRMALALALSLVVAPYANAYDGVLLAPLAFAAFALLERRPILLAIAGMAVVAISWWISISVVADWGSQSATAILPIGTLVGTAFIALFVRARRLSSTTYPTPALPGSDVAIPTSSRRSAP